MTDEWIAALGRYAGRLHATAGGKHHVASPLGAWLLLAMTAAADRSSSAAPGGAPAEGAGGGSGGALGGGSGDAFGGGSGDALGGGSGEALGGGSGEALGEVLGVAPRRAAEVATALLAEPHPLVAAASAVWHSAQVTPERLAGWLARLPATTESGPLPDQAGLDRWARENTFGLIDTFPVEPTPATVLVLASALATKLSWDQPFEVAEADALGGDWAPKLTRVLRTPEAGHTAFVTTSRAAGQVIVHVAPATDDAGAQVRVVSVAAAADVAPERVIAAAYEIGADLQAYDRTSLFDLPLGDAPLWTIREERVASNATEQVSAVLPAWSVTSDHDLSGPGLGFDVATRVLEPVLGFTGLQFEAHQKAIARFSRYGFEAAAVTAFMTLTSVPPEQVVRFAELRFAHPYAVVAVTGGGGAWDGVPVFSAWVSDPSDDVETSGPDAG